MKRNPTIRRFAIRDRATMRERAAAVAWLRAAHELGSKRLVAADAIGPGEHRKGTT